MTPGADPKNHAERGRARLDDIATAERRLQLTAEAIEEYAQRVQEFSSSLPRRGVKQPIDADLGTVVVDGTGRLRDIQLDVRRIRDVSANTLGERIVRAIRVGEAKAKNFRDRGLKELSDASRISE